MSAQATKKANFKTLRINRSPLNVLWRSAHIEIKATLGSSHIRILSSFGSPMGDTLPAELQDSMSLL